MIATLVPKSFDFVENTAVVALTGGVPVVLNDSFLC